MSTVLDICTAAALNIGAVQSGEPLEASEAADILATWQRLISSSNTQSNTVFSIRLDNYTLSPGVQTYTFGTDPNTGNVGTLSAVRPVRITGINLILPGSSLLTPRALMQLEAEDWQRLPIRNAPGFPRAFYLDKANPLATLYFDFIPDQNYQVNVFSWDKLPTAANLSDIVVFPDGYERYWVTKLAIEIAPMFAATPSAALVAIATEAEANVRSLNSRGRRLVTDPALTRRRGYGLYNFLTGQVR